MRSVSGSIEAHSNDEKADEGALARHALCVFMTEMSQSRPDSGSRSDGGTRLSAVGTCYAIVVAVGMRHIL